MRKLLILLVLIATAVTAGERSRFPYIYKQGGQSHLRNSGTDIEQLVRISKRWAGDFVWLRVDGKSWLIQDAAILGQIRTAFAPMRALEPKMRAASEQLHPYEVKSEAIEKKMDALSDSLDDEESEQKREQAETKLRELERQMQAIEGDLRAAERTVESIEREMDRLEVIAEAKFEEIVLRAVRTGKAVRVDS